MQYTVLNDRTTTANSEIEVGLKHTISLVHIVDLRGSEKAYYQGVCGSILLSVLAGKLLQTQTSAVILYHGTLCSTFDECHFFHLPPRVNSCR